MIDWKVKIPESYEKQGTMPFDRAKLERMNKIAELLEEILKEIRLKKLE